MIESGDNVLILVLVETGISVEFLVGSGAPFGGLNPCSSGNRDIEKEIFSARLVLTRVLILVLVETGISHFINTFQDVQAIVLILVLVETGISY